MSILASLLFVLTFAEGQAGMSTQTTLSIVGTSDLHGHIAALPWFSGYVRNLRAARRPGAVILLDAGDLFQGTLESNLTEGAPVVDAYNAIGYTAATIGNHEFDFGPQGPAPSPAKPTDDPQGALKARAAQAHFPFLAANVLDRASHKPVAWRNVLPSTLIDADGVKVGIVGVVTAATPRLALPANVANLEFLPLATTIQHEARRLRARGAKLVIAVAHEGGACKTFTNPDDLVSCDVQSQIFSVATRLPKGSVDAIVAGHTHQAIAQRVAGIPIIQSYSNGRAFGRVDLTVDHATGTIVASHLERPREVCPSSTPETCKPGTYFDQPVEKDEQLASLLAPAFTAAKRQSEESLGVEVLRPFSHNRSQETALGNLLADLIRVRYPNTHVAMMNGGGVRAGLPAGPLTFGRLFQAFPFDNTVAFVKVSAHEFRRLLGRNLSSSSSLVSLSGVRVQARCKGKTLKVTLGRLDGTPLPDNTLLHVAASDFLALGGDGFFAHTALTFEMGPPLREEIAEALRRRGGTLAPDDPVLLDPAHPRFDLPGPVPIHCDRLH